MVTLNRADTTTKENRFQVVSILGNASFTAMRARTYSGDSMRSASPPPDTPPSPAASPSPDSPPLPAVKGVVEKPDSVSWVLEIEETPEEVASRLVPNFR